MSYSFEYIDIILLAMIAGFIFLRLRGILGKKTGFEEDINSSFPHEVPQSKPGVDLNANTFDENAKKFVYGKLNSLYSLRIGLGSRKIAFEKLRQNGVQIAINCSYGTSIGLIKPIFLEVFQYDYSGRIAGISLERYDPEQHGFFNIYGRGSWSAGLLHTKINPGAYFKFGMEFEFSTTREIINSLELGITADAFMNPIIIMVDNQSYRFFPSIYLSCSIGNKFY